MGVIVDIDSYIIVIVPTVFVCWLCLVDPCTKRDNQVIFQDLVSVIQPLDSSRKDFFHFGASKVYGFFSVVGDFRCGGDVVSVSHVD